MSPIFLMLPGTTRWELVDVGRPERPLISGWSLDRPVAHQLVSPTPTIRHREETQV